jgi:photosystem II stability/assembly factor-like uncharacterized protein
MAVGLMAGCDDDPTGPAPSTLTPSILNDSIIGRQEALRVVFNSRIDPRTGLDPENFVVTNLCTGLRVPGALRIGTDAAGNRDTLIFSPSSTLPFLTPLSIRVQNILTPNGRALQSPFTLNVRTETPPVADISWEVTDSPTQDPGSGIFYLDRDRGFYSTATGTVFRTPDGGDSWEFLFKNDELTGIRSIRAATPDTLYFSAAPSLGGTTISATGLFRSTDSGRTFASIFVQDPGDIRHTVMRKLTGRKPILLSFGNVGRLAVWRVDENAGTVTRFGPVAPLIIGNGGDLSRDASRAVAVGLTTSPTPGTFNGAAMISLDSGKTFTQVTGLPADTRQLRGAGFVDNTTAFLLGDSSTVVRLNTTTGEATRLGAAAGIPQRTVATDNTITTYHFTRAEFATDDPDIGFIIGYSVIDRPVGGDIKRGDILMTRDGGGTWTQQAVSGAGENGLGFPPLGEFAGQGDLHVLAHDFANVAGNEGFIAQRPGDVEVVTAVCAFNEP